MFLQCLWNDRFSRFETRLLLKFGGGILVGRALRLWIWVGGFVNVVAVWESEESAKFIAVFDFDSSYKFVGYVAGAGLILVTIWVQGYLWVCVMLVVDRLYTWQVLFDD